MLKFDFFKAYRVLFVFIFLVSCSDDPDPQPDSLYGHGVFIVNEGNFSDTDGSLSFFDLDSQKVTQKVFELVNNRPFAGLFQSLTFFDNRGFLIDQLGRLEVVNENNLQSLISIENGFDIPRYFAGYGSVGFVSDWGPYDENFMNPESTIKIIDLNNYSHIREIESPSRPEDMLILNDKLYVANSGTNSVSIYDPSAQLLIKELETGYGPVQFVTDKNDDIWVICTGAFITTASLYAIDTNLDEVFYSTELETFSPSGRITINGAGDVIYFITEQFAPDFSFTETVIYKVSLLLDGIEPGLAQPPGMLIRGTNWYGIGMDPVTDILYVADAAAFQANGKIFRYTSGGDLIDEFQAGRGPRDFVFRD